MGIRIEIGYTDWNYGFGLVVIEATNIQYFNVFLSCVKRGLSLMSIVWIIHLTINVIVVIVVVYEYATMRYI